MPFNKKVTMTKRNHVYFGATQSDKVAVTLEEASVDLVNVYDQFNVHQDTMDAFASGYMDPSGRIKDISAQVSEIENTVEKMSYIQATQDPIF